jgi:hypothetical protein
MKNLTKYAFAAGTALVLTANVAMADPLTFAYGNTLLVSYEDGLEVSIFVEENNTYTGQLADGTEIGGTWAAEGEEVCFTRTTPESAEAACNTFAEDLAVGSSWEGTGLNEQTAKFSIVEGREVAAAAEAAAE